MLSFSQVRCLLVLVGLALGAASARADYPATILAEQPVAYWRLNDAEGKTAANSAKSPPSVAPPSLLDGKLVADVAFGKEGPRADRFPDFETGNTAAMFDGKGDFIRVTDPGEGSVLDFGDGDSITMEAWVSLTNIGEGQQRYIFGKGRTGRPGVAKDNQNYSLRLRSMPGGERASARISFLFRDADNRRSDDPASGDDWHRWTSSTGILEGSGWHHVAITYTFGSGKSIKGYIDGGEVPGVWDMGGETDEPPVVDDDELWIGSSMGVNDNSTFDGLIDEVALYRSALSRETLIKHFKANLPPNVSNPPALVGPLSKDVGVEILEGIPDKRTWDFTPPAAGDRYLEPAFGFAGLPKKYSDKGVVVDRKPPFLLRANANLQLPAGEYRLLLRARGATRLSIDDLVVLQTKFRNPNASGHEAVPDLPTAREPGLRPLAIGHQEQLVTIKLDGGKHAFRLEAILADQKARPEVGELSVSIAASNEPFYLLGPVRDAALTDDGWVAYRTADVDRLRQRDLIERRQRGAQEALYWDQRHATARQVWESKPAPAIPGGSPDAPIAQALDRFLDVRLQQAKVKPAPLVDDYTFLRRVTLDTIGLIPTRAEIADLIADKRPDRRERVVDRLLADPRWADHWVAYWQDVLAENPGILKPELNNSGPFRFWIHESFTDNKPMDRFATELVMMEGSPYGGGPAGFAMATQNDAPMAEKAHVIAKAFLAVDLKCARCHDAPFHPFKQEDTFNLAAMLSRGPQKLPKSSTVPLSEGSRRPLIKITLKPGATIAPNWPFVTIAAADSSMGLVHDSTDSREQLAAMLTSPHNDRFPKVLVNRLWKRYLGWGLIEPVDDWHDAKASHPELLDYLARELVLADYDLKHVARLLLTSQAYQRQVQPEGTQPKPAAERLFASPARRRLSAEQLVDSLFTAADKPLGCEELSFDPENRRPIQDFLNLGVPARGWEMASLSNERDRPALSLPNAQGIVDLLATFGWRESRQNPLSQRDETPSPLQPLTVANGLLGSRATGLCDQHAVTHLCLEERTLENLVRDVFLQVLSRPPTAAEKSMFEELLSRGYAQRRVGGIETKDRKGGPGRSAVSWSNHLSPEASRIKLELERQARLGDPPTPRLVPEWRERMEDMLWSLVNSPEFMFVP